MEGPMISNSLLVLTSTAALIGLVHTLVGPDHYVPFVAMSRARNWSWPKTAIVTILCGVGHVMSSVLIGTVGIAAGIAVSRLEAFESTRGTVAAWLLIAFGLLYGIWGVKRAMRGRPHTHVHIHPDGVAHSHEHSHTGDHLHVHGEKAGSRSITPWMLFVIFVFGPCEPLIPLLMFPAATESAQGVALVASVFGLVTISTMLAMVLTLAYGLKAARLQRIDRYSHALAGLIIAVCGVMILAGF
jgi:nickel/cobalt exporter